MTTEAKVLEGHLNASGLKTAIIASRFNHLFVEKLVKGAMDGLVRHGATAQDQTIVWVPGGWEMPIATERAAQTRRFDAIICVGAVIRGGTPHFDFVAGEMIKGIAQVQLKHNIPLTMGILTTDNLEQAIERCGTKMGNKGFEAAVAAIETVQVLRALEA